MHYKTAAAFRQALEARLKDQSPGDGARLVRLRKLIAFDRLLARLAAEAPDGWLLKGGYSLQLRLPDRARTTMDVDLAWRGDDDDLLDTLIDAANSDLGDFFRLSIERTADRPDSLGGAHRFRVVVTLAGREFDTFVLDVGRADAAVVAPKLLATPDLLEFAGLAPVQVPATTLSQQVAEKLHAYTRQYGNDQPSSRTKDLVDLVLIAELFEVDAEEILDDLHAVFESRGTHALPHALPDPPQEWRVPFRRMATEAGIEPDMASSHALAAALLDPLLNGDVSTGIWIPTERRWP